MRQEKAKNYYLSGVTGSTLVGLWGVNDVGNNKFFSKDIMPKCEYCHQSRAISGGKEYFCIKKGFVEPFDHCRSYKYDPLKRVPANKVISKNYEKDNFLI